MSDPQSQRDVEPLTRWRISEYMHAVYMRGDWTRETLQKAAGDCARWYDVTVDMVIQIWFAVHPRDLDVRDRVLQQQEEN